MPNKKAKERKWAKKKLAESHKKFGRTKKQIARIKKRNKIREQKLKERYQSHAEYKKRKW
jgi:cell shape-determining protein MreC|tara:strand:- start:263 stop:442 length:180 start_codon:yes stop_codon:yes gene_type:complete